MTIVAVFALLVVCVYASKEQSEASKLLAIAKGLHKIGKLNADSEDLLSGELGLENPTSEHTGSSSSSSSTKTQLSTSDRIHVAVEERLIEQAIKDALAAPKSTPAAVLKKAYQARYEISQFDANELVNGDELNFGPTVITTRSNFFLQGALRQSEDNQLQHTTAGDFLDTDLDGEPDVLKALVAFRDTNNPSDYMRIMRNRAIGADRKTGTIALINLIRLDGVFSQTNQLLSPCFSATNQPEFVFESLVGVEPGQKGVLTAKPEQTSSILLSASTAFDDAQGGRPPREDRNIFWDADAKDFVEVAEAALWINLIPDTLIPGADDVRRQGTVYFTECSQFNYFQ